MRKGMFASAIVTIPSAVEIIYDTVVTDVANLTTYNFTVNMTTGIRKAVAIMGEGGSATTPYNIVSATWDGATILPAVSAGGGNSSLAAVYILDNKSSGTYTFSITFSGTMARTALASWVINNYSGTTDPKTAMANSGTSISVTHDIGIGQGVISAYCTGTSVTYTWTNITKDFELALESATTGVSGAHRNGGSAAPGTVISVSHANSSQPIAIASVLIV